jgi:hypothetical protein
MKSGTRTISREKAMTVLRRAGYPPDVVKEIAAQLPDPIDLDRYSALLQRYGITTQSLVNRMGGSP